MLNIVYSSIHWIIYTTIYIIFWDYFVSDGVCLSVDFWSKIVLLFNKVCVFVNLKLILIILERCSYESCMLSLYILLKCDHCIDTCLSLWDAYNRWVMQFNNPQIALVFLLKYSLVVSYVAHLRYTGVQIRSCRK